MYRDTSPHSRHCHATTLLSATAAHILLSTNPSVHRRLLHISFHPLRTILLARVRCSRITKLSSLHPFYCDFNAVGVCTSRGAYSNIGHAVPCYFGSILCPNIPRLRLRPVVPRVPFAVKSVGVLPIIIVRSHLPVLTCHFSGLTCIASVGAVSSSSLTVLSNIRALIIDTLQ